MSFWPLSVLERWVQRRDYQKGIDQEHVHAVALYKHPSRTKGIAVFFVENGNHTLYCCVDHYDAYEAETVTPIVVDGIAWCQDGKLPSHSRPMDHLPAKEQRSQKRYQNLYGPEEYESLYKVFGDGRS